MVYGVIAQIARPLIGRVGRYIYQSLRTQDKLIDYTYRKTGLYNRGIVQGVKHGLIGGQIAGGILQLGLNAPETPGNDAQIPSSPRSKYPPRKSYQTRGRFSTGYKRRCPTRPYANQRR